MRKALLAAVLSLSLATPAFANSMTLQFIETDGETTTYWVDGNQYSNSRSQSGEFVMSSNGKEVCFSRGGYEECASLTRSLSNPSSGDASEFVFDDGAGGTVTVTSAR